MPSSASPGGRAYFGYWQSGFQLYVTGGEGPGSTLQDTWAFNFYTKVPARGPAHVSTRGIARAARSIDLQERAQSHPWIVVSIAQLPKRSALCPPPAKLISREAPTADGFRTVPLPHDRYTLDFAVRSRSGFWGTRLRF